MSIDGKIEVQINPQVKLHYRCYGSLNDPIILAIHGFGEGAYVWDTLRNDLPKKWCLITVDLRGHGNSDWDKNGNYYLHNYVSDISKLLDELLIGQCSIVGHSLGGQIGCMIAAQRYHNVKSLALVDFGINLSEIGQDRALADFKDSFGPFGSHEDYVDWLTASRPLTAPELKVGISQQGLELREGLLYSRCDPVLIEYAKVVGDETNIKIALREILCPTLIIRGVGSAVFPPQAARETADRILRSEVKTIPKAGHAVVVENPGILARELIRFFEMNYDGDNRT